MPFSQIRGNFEGSFKFLIITCMLNLIQICLIVFVLNLIQQFF